MKSVERTVVYPEGLSDDWPDSMETFLCLNNRSTFLTHVWLFITSRPRDKKTHLPPKKPSHSSRGPYLLRDIEVIELPPAVLITRACAVCRGVRQARQGSSARTQLVTHSFRHGPSLCEFKTRESEGSSEGLQCV